jgi:hypothetical protein
MKHNKNSVIELTETQLQALGDIVECTHRPQGVTFYAVSGDDIYAVLPSHLQENSFIYVKLLLCSKPNSSHFVSEYGFFDNQFVASQYLCKQAAEEERGYDQ